MNGKQVLVREPGRTAQRTVRSVGVRLILVARTGNVGLPDSQIQGPQPIQAQVGCPRHGVGGEIIFVSHAI